MAVTRVRRYAVAATVLVALAGAALTVAAARGGDPEPHRHSSGLWVLADLEGARVPPELSDQFGAYDLLSEAYPQELRYAHVEAGRLVVDAASDQGVELATAMSAGEALPAVDRGIDPYRKMKAMLAEKSGAVRGKPIVIRRVTQSRADVDRIQNGVIDFARDPALADAEIWETSADPATGRVVVRMTKLTDAAAAAIVDAYGTERVVVIEEGDPHAGPA
jgi:hypothetical protein